MNTEERSASQEVEFDRPNLFTGIFRDPVGTVKYALENMPETFIHRHFMMVAFAFTMMLRLPDWLTVAPSPIEIMIMLLVVPALSGVLLSYIFSACLRNLAKWFNQLEIHKIEMRTVVAWSHFPFTVTYFAALLSYLVLFLLRTPDERLKIFTGTAVDYIPVVILGLGFAFALYLRWRSLAFFFQVSLGRAAGLWFMAFLMTYGPALLFLAVYVAIYVRSMSWLAFKVGL